MIHAGQPTKYDESIIGKLQEYVKTCGREATELPTIEGFAAYVDVDPDTIGNWGDAFPEFFGAIKKMKARQKNQLINDGLYGGKEVNQAMAIFLLKANHGMVETSRMEVSGENGGPIQYKIITGRGFIPAGVIVDATSEENLIGGQQPVQDSGMAQKSPQNNDSNL
jgi:hypothetical protein